MKSEDNKLIKSGFKLNATINWKFALYIFCLLELQFFSFQPCFSHHQPHWPTFADGISGQAHGFRVSLIFFYPVITSQIHLPFSYAKMILHKKTAVILRHCYLFQTCDCVIKSHRQEKSVSKLRWFTTVASFCSRMEHLVEKWIQTCSTTTKNASFFLSKWSGLSLLTVCWSCCGLLRDRWLHLLHPWLWQGWQWGDGCRWWVVVVLYRAACRRVLRLSEDGNLWSSGDAVN